MDHPSQASPSSSSRSFTNDADSATPQNGATHRKRRKVTRSKAGCLTCRKRRKLCDMAKPDCHACFRLKLDCAWPADNAPEDVQVQAVPPSLNVFQEDLRAIPSKASPSLMQAHLSVSPVVANISPSTQPPLTPWTGPMNDLVGIFGDVRQSSGNSYPGFPSTNDISTAGLAPNPPTYAADPFSTFDAYDSTQGEMASMDSLLDGVDFDEATLQLWAANCLAIPSTQTVDPFYTLSSLLRSEPTPVQAVQSSIPAAPQRRSASRPRSRSNSPTSAHHAPLLHHYQQSLCSLVSCTGDSAPSAFSAFTQLANVAASSEAGKGLHLSILAWAGRHMTNQGQTKYEAVSERLGDKAGKIVLDKVGEFREGSTELSETERMTLLAGLLMMVQFKICRGDVWGFEVFTHHLKQLSKSLYTPDSPGVPPDSMPFSFFENLLYHDLLSSLAYLRSPMIPYSTLTAYSSSSIDSLHTLTGACLPLFIKMHRITGMTHQRRERTKRAGVWGDESLVDLITATDELERELKDEKSRIDSMVQAKPSIASHRYLHEAFRIACLLSLHSFILCEPAASLRIRLLVRQSLSLLEEMCDGNLPGWCSAHWVLFVTATCCCPGGQEGDGEDDCGRIERLYDDVISEYAFGNSARSRKVVHEVWARYQEGKVHVDWLDIVGEFDWELWLV